LAALNLLLTDPNITDDDAKARAAMRGVRITAASINGARNHWMPATYDPKFTNTSQDARTRRHDPDS
jgi:hypothetical protein